MKLISGVKSRQPGCTCHQEEGDSDCHVHGCCSNPQPNSLDDNCASCGHVYAEPLPEWSLSRPIAERCLHATPNSGGRIASELHGVCIFCWRDRCGAALVELEALRAAALAVLNAPMGHEEHVAMRDMRKVLNKEKT